MASFDMTNDILYTIKNPKVTFNQRLKDMAKIENIRKSQRNTLQTAP